MKKTMYVLPIFAILVGCNQTESEQRTILEQSDLKTEIVEKNESELKKVRIGFIASDTGNEPLNFRDEKGGLQGFEYDVLQEIARRAHYDFVYSYQPRQDLFEYFNHNTVDVIAGSMGITDERRNKYAMSNSYLEVYPVTIISKNKNLKTLKQLEDKSVAIKNSSMDSLYKIVNEEKKDDLKNIQYVKSNWLAVQSVLSDKAEAAISDSSVIPYYVEKYSEKKSPLYFSIDYAYPQEYYGFVLDKSQTELLDDINTSLADMKADGTYQSIYKKWF